MIKNETNYIFSHVILKGCFFEKQKKYSDILFKEENEEIKKMLKIMWDHSFEIGSKRNIGIEKQEFNCKIKKGKFDDGLLYLALELPTPEYVADCKYIGILYNSENNEAKYITLEKSYDLNTDGYLKKLIGEFTGKTKEAKKESYFLGGWISETHLNYGQINDCNFEEFIDILKGIN